MYLGVLLLSVKVDMSKVSLDTIKPWITQRVTQLLGVEDDIVVEFVFNLLEKKQVRIHLFLPPFLPLPFRSLFL